MRIVGLDLALANSGIGIINSDHAGDGPRGWAHRAHAPAKLAKRELRHERMEWMAGEIVRACAGAHLIVLEGASFGSVNSAFDMGGGWWVIKHYLWRAGHRMFVIVQPSTLKVYATGYGGSKQRPVGKNEVRDAIIARYPAVDIGSSDAADGLGLAAMAAHRYGFPLAPVPATHARALESVTWPDPGDLARHAVARAEAAR